MIHPNALNEFPSRVAEGPETRRLARSQAFLDDHIHVLEGMRQQLARAAESSKHSDLKELAGQRAYVLGALIPVLRQVYAVNAKVVGVDSKVVAG